MTATRMGYRARPTNADLQEQIGEAHDCIHKQSEHLAELAAEVKRDRETADARAVLLDTRWSAMEARTAATDARVELIVQFFGLRTPKIEGARVRGRITMASLEWWKAVVGIVTAVVGSMTGWHYLIPPLEAFVHALMKG